jgi:hypothetical protein
MTEESGTVVDVVVVEDELDTCPVVVVVVAIEPGAVVVVVLDVTGTALMEGPPIRTSTTTAIATATRTITAARRGWNPRGALLRPAGELVALNACAGR